MTDHPAKDVYPDWSPDGQLAFVSDRDGAPRIYLADPERPGQARVLTDQIVNQGDPGAGQGALAVRWSPDGALVGFIHSTETSTALWCVRRDGTDPRELVPGAQGFDWYRDNDHVVYSKVVDGRDTLFVMNVVTGDVRELWKGPHMEIDAAPDGHAVLMSHGKGHLGMGLWRLNLEQPAEAGGLPSLVGDAPESLVLPDDNWHVHHGSFDFDSKRIVFIHDLDEANIFERVPED